MAIIDEVEEGIKGVCNNYLIEPDRAKAIELAINMAEPVIWLYWLVKGMRITRF